MPNLYSSALLVLLLTACATDRWVQTGKTDAEAQKALVECENMAGPNPGPFADPVYKEHPWKAVKECMERKGYRFAMD